MQNDHLPVEETISYAAPRKVQNGKQRGETTKSIDSGCFKKFAFLGQEASICTKLCL